ncbi:SLAF5 protein, partial [Chauna torquata]|nr:SLAF5 protein [Chauna torquata]
CASSGSDMTGAEGRSVTFHLQNLKGENLAWSFCGESILAFKLVKPLEATFFDNSYKSRVAFPEDGSALTISQLRRSDAGTYVARNTEFRANFTLRVYSELLEPTVTCVSQNCSADGCRYTLRCAAEPPGDKAFFWSNGEQPWGEGPEVVLETSPPGGSDPLLYTCTVQNPVSSRNATISPSALCAGESPQKMRG